MKKGATIVAIACLMIAGFADQTVVRTQDAEKARGGSPRIEGDEIVFNEGLTAGGLGRYGRSAIHSDPVEYRLATDTFVLPKEGDTAGKSRNGKEQAWVKITADEEGWFKGQTLRGGYLHVTMESPEERTKILEATGHSLVFVNGEPRGGDVYSYGWVQHPVRLLKGANSFLFRISRGKMRAKLTTPPGSLFLTNRDILLPDLLLDEADPAWGAVRVINATEETVKDLEISCQAEGVDAVVAPVPQIGPMTSRKVGFRFGTPEGAEAGKTEARLSLARSGGSTTEPLDTLDVKMNVVSPGSRHKVTFVSDIDGSIQYYSVTPGKLEGDARPALFLSCHGAAVKAEGQAGAYGPKSWGHVVAPTNRRPFGFDWEDWGRLDALEVLGLAEKRFDTDPQRTYLTGHSMGGHGTWHLGVTYPARFAAIAPSAGWYSFWSYGGKKRDGDSDPMEELFARGSNPSDTIGLSRNFLHHGIYILHGDRDDNVPVSEARFMRKHLSGYHADFAYYERPGAGHWGGGKCCDWPPLFDFLKHHTAPKKRDKKTVEFLTANPGVSAQSHWLTIESQIQALKISGATITQDVKERTFTGTTENVERLALDLDQLDPGDTVTIKLDGQELKDIPAPVDGQGLHLLRRSGVWEIAEKGGPGMKGPHRYGTFKDAFRNRVVFVYSTQGSEAENAWSYAKARYDAETFWYRGNGSIDVLADTEFDPTLDLDRNVVLYGNAETNSVWKPLLATSPVQVGRERIAIGDVELKGADLGCNFIRPRPGSSIASVGVVAGTGIQGMKAANSNMYFISGSGYPDLLVFSVEMLDKHFDGVRAVGYFGPDWSIRFGEFAFSD